MNGFKRLPTGIEAAELSWSDRIRNYAGTFMDPDQPAVAVVERTRYYKVRAPYQKRFPGHARNVAKQIFAVALDAVSTKVLASRSVSMKLPE